MSLALLSLTYALWRDGKLWAAGLVCSLLLYKPQLILGVGVLWFLEWFLARRGWQSLAGLAAGGSYPGRVELHIHARCQPRIHRILTENSTRVYHLGRLPAVECPHTTRLLAAALAGPVLAFRWIVCVMPGDRIGGIWGLLAQVSQPARLALCWGDRPDPLANPACDDLRLGDITHPGSSPVAKLLGGLERDLCPGMGCSFHQRSIYPWAAEAAAICGSNQRACSGGLS